MNKLFATALLCTATFALKMRAVGDTVMIPPMVEPIAVEATKPVKPIDAAVEAMAKPVKPIDAAVEAMEWKPVKPIDAAVEAMATPVEAMATPVLDMVNPVEPMEDESEEVLYAEYDYYGGEDMEELYADYDYYGEDDLAMVEPVAEDLYADFEPMEEDLEGVVYAEYDYYGEDHEEHPEDYDMYAEWDYYGEEDVEEAAEVFDIHTVDWSYFCSEDGHAAIPMIFDQVDLNGDGTISAVEALQEDMMSADELAFFLAH